MFKNMMKYKKAWSKFCKWLGVKYNIDFDKTRFYKLKGNDVSVYEIYLEDEIILNLIPTFMDEQGKHITIYNYVSKLGVIFYYGITSKDIGYSIHYKTRQEALIKACEKSFEILEENK